MGGKPQVVQKHAADLRDYTNTVAAVHLLKEVLTGNATVSIDAVNIIVAQENAHGNPNIGNVVKAILAAAGQPGTNPQWKAKGANWQLDAAITIGGAVYTVNFELDPLNPQKYTVNITSKLEENNPVARGKLFFDPSNNATVKLTYIDGELNAITEKGLEISSTSRIPYPYQNEILAKFCQSLTAPESSKQQRLAVLGTGSGKSVVMTGIAQAVGKTVMIVPDKTLVDQQVKEIGDMFRDATINRQKVAEPRAFTINTLMDQTNADIAWAEITNEKGDIDLSQISQENLEILANEFSAALTEDNYDQIVLQAEHPLFKIIAPKIQDALVLIDESHRHTFNEEDTSILSTLKENNSILALTATPTSKLYDIFPGAPLDDLSLGGAIEIGTIRPIKPEVSYAKSGDLITQAVTNYFNDYYLKPGMNGYTDPLVLKTKIMDASEGHLSEKAAEDQAIEQALVLNRIRAQRNMAFSDEKTTRATLQEIYQKISDGDVETINAYKDDVAEIRRDAEIDARLAMVHLFHPETTREQIEQEVALTPVDLVSDIRTEQNKDIQRTINSYALSLVFGDKQAAIAERDRTHKLDEHLQRYDEGIANYDPDGENENFANRPLLSKLNEIKDLDRNGLSAKFKKAQKDSPILKLPQAQKEVIIEAILAKAEDMVKVINHDEGTIASIIKTDSPIDLNELGAVAEYAGSVDMDTPASNVTTQLAQIEVGIKTHIVSDKLIATGVSIKDVLNVQTINNYSAVVEPDLNAINGTLSGPQAAGRCVRHNDVSARAQQYIDERYQGKNLILTLDEMIDARHSAANTKAVILKREKEAQKEELAHSKFDAVLNEIAGKAQTFQREADKFYNQSLGDEAQNKDYKKYQAAADAANKLHNNLEAASTQYFKDGNKEVFKSVVDDEIRAARNSELKNHRGGKEILVNSLKATLTLGILPACNYASSNKQFFFAQVNTSSINKVNELEKRANEIVQLAL